MKGKNLLLSAIIIAVAGIIMIITHATVNTQGLAIACGIMFILAGVVDIFVFMNRRPRQSAKNAAATPEQTAAGNGAAPAPARQSVLSTFFGWLTMVGSIVLGLSMLIFRDTFSGVIAFMFAILVAFGALMQLYILLFGTRPARLSPYFYIAPLLLAGASAYLFTLEASADDPLLMLVSGIAFTFFGVVTLVEGLVARSVINAMARQAQMDAEAADKAEKRPEHILKEKAASGQETRQRSLDDDDR